MIALLLGCGDPERPPPTDVPEVPDVIPWLLPATTPTEIALDPVLTTAQRAIDLVARIDPDPVLDAYRDLAAAADEVCPAVYMDDELDYWLDTCVTADGTRFSGFGLDDEQTTADATGVTTVTATGGSGRIDAPDGTFVEVEGYVQRIDDGQGYGVTASTLILAGDFSTNHPAAGGTWVEDGVRPNLVITRYDVLGDRVLVAAVGAVDGLDGPNPAVAFQETAILDPGFGYGGCALEPSGSVSVRLGSGEWVDVVFEPVLTDDGLVTVDAKDCDGCGLAWYRAEPLGQVCLDFSRWLE